MVAIQKFFNDGEDIVGCNPNCTFLHNCIFLSFKFLTMIFQKNARLFESDILTLFNYYLSFRLGIMNRRHDLLILLIEINDNSITFLNRRPNNHFSKFIFEVFLYGPF